MNLKVQHCFLMLTLLSSNITFAQIEADDNEIIETSERKTNYTDESECQSVDYRNLYSLKKRDQKNIGWCFAHASADNIQMQEKINEQISAADIAIKFSNSPISKVTNFFDRIFNPNKDQTAPENGLAKVAIKMIESEGYCPESVFPSENWTRVDLKGNKKPIEIETASTEIFKFYDDIHKKLDKNNSIQIKDVPFYYEFTNRLLKNI